MVGQEKTIAWLGVGLDVGHHLAVAAFDVGLVAIVAPEPVGTGQEQERHPHGSQRPPQVPRATTPQPTSR